MGIHRMELVVRPTDVDVLGHVNNAKYLEYLEWGRVRWYRENRLLSPDVLEQNLNYVVASIHINYRLEVKMDERLTVQTFLARLGNSSMVLKQEILNEQGQRVADAEVIIVLFDTSLRKSTPFPEAMRKRLEALVVTESGPAV
ncbi:MAG: hypothetical protein BAA01_10345 [Bacillus thermozeamaize]|uniref:Thioesterase n=1 Tax=Bacillus thermozeamaize TaxID=230954 RepID=A0A1Y3PDS5_9BACI|nr:MAG: hypothetical protein BAA01_10345 [Bacillus thermozeamaize]